MKEKEFMRAKEAAEFLSISVYNLYKMNQHKVIPHYKPSKKGLYYKRSDLIEYIESSRVEKREVNNG